MKVLIKWQDDNAFFDKPCYVIGKPVPEDYPINTIVKVKRTPQGLKNTSYVGRPKMLGGRELPKEIASIFPNLPPKDETVKEYEIRETN